MDPSLKGRALGNVGVLLKVDESLLNESSQESKLVKQTQLTLIKAEIDRLLVKKQKLEAHVKQIESESQLNEQFLIAQQSQLMSYEKKQDLKRRALEGLGKETGKFKEETKRLIEKHQRELGLYERARSDVSDSQSQDPLSELLMTQLGLYDRELQQQGSRISYLVNAAGQEVEMLAEVTQLLAGELATAQKQRIADLQTLLRQERELAYLKQRLPDVVATGKTAVRGKKCVIDLS
jgi:hypothetical protein